MEESGILETEEDHKDKPRKPCPNIFQKILLEKEKTKKLTVSPTYKQPSKNYTTNSFNYNYGKYINNNIVRYQQ